MSDAAVKQMKKETPRCIQGIDTCIKDKKTCPSAKLRCGKTFLGPVELAGKTYFDVRKMTCPNPIWCYDFTSVITWMTQPSTTEALGVRDGSEKWAVCNLRVNSHFQTDWMMDFHKDVSKLLGSGVRLLVYAGSMDYIGNWVGCKAWTMAEGRKTSPMVTANCATFT